MRRKTPELSVRLAYCHSSSSTKSENTSRVYHKSPGPSVDSRISKTCMKPPVPAICHPARAPLYSGLKAGFGFGVRDATIAPADLRAKVSPVSDGLAEPAVGNSAGPAT